MCFSFMKTKMDQYIGNAQLFKDDFNLIFTNAYNYNKPKDRAYKDAERVQEKVIKVIERKWDKLIEKQEMTLEEREHQLWVQKEIEFDPEFLDKSEDVEVPKKKFKYIPQKAKQEKDEMADFINEPEAEPSSHKSNQDSENDDNEIGAKLRARNKPRKYNDIENYTSFSGDGKDEKNQNSKQGLNKQSSINKTGNCKKGKKNNDVQFSSDDEMENIKNISLNDIDFSNPQNLTTKHLLENPEELEDLDIKQYYHNPVR